MKDLLKVIGAVVLGLIIAVLLSFLLGWFVMLLWNALLPAIFGITAITYWQGVGISLLCNLLFKGTWSSSSKKDK